MTPPTPETTAVDLIQTFRTWVPIAILVGTGLGSLIIAVIIGVYKFVKTQTMNGDGRTLRKAVDDLATDVSEHRHEVRTHFQTIGDILDTTATRLAVVEAKVAGKH